MGKRGISRAVEPNGSNATSVAIDRDYNGARNIMLINLEKCV